MPPSTQVQPEALVESSRRLVRTVDGLAEEDWRSPSGLPGWTRAHVVAHLVLNAEGLGAAVRGVLEGVPAPMYSSQEARDGDIEELAAREPAELRGRLMAATTELDDALAALPEDRQDTRIERVPGGRTFRAAAVPGMRLREVEIHHADLATGYARHDWSTDFAELLVEAMTKQRDAWSRPFTAHAIDTGRTWTFTSPKGGAEGADGPTVSGTTADLAWWLTGRGDGEGLTSDDGELPRIEAW